MASKPTLRDVARMAGVSRTTASVVLSRGNQFDRISSEVVQRVEASARALGYVPNHAMRTVRLGRAEMIGMPLQVDWAYKEWSQRIATFYFDEIWSGMRLVCQQAGYMPVQILSRPEESVVKRGLHAIRSGQLDGMVVPGTGSLWPDVKALHDVPVVLVDPSDPSSPLSLPAVTFNAEAGLALIIEHLQQLGHRSVLWLGQEKPIRPRERHFIAAAKDADIQWACCRYEPPHDDIDRKTEHPRTALLEYLQTCASPPPFTAIVCESDITAVGALRALRTAGLRVPQDMSVIGFDRIQSDFTIPQLTTIDHRLFEMGKIAAECLLRLIQTDEKHRQEFRGLKETVAPELIIGQSTGPAPDRR